MPEVIPTAQSPAPVKGPKPRRKKKNKNKKKKEQKEPPSNAELIRQSMSLQPVKVWGFVFVRCTYSDESRWRTFVEQIEKATISKLEGIGTTPEERDFLKEHFRLTTLEDKEKLDGATMYDASIRFRNWSIGEGAISEKGSYSASPRWEYYIYVNEESLESVINPERAKEITGYFLILVNLRNAIRVESNDEDPSGYYPEDEGDEAFKLIVADTMVYDYPWAAEDPDSWYGHCSLWYGPPFVHGRSSFMMDWWAGIVQEDKKGAIGLNVYNMLRRMYGKGHYRSPPFTAEAAQTNAQRLRGYNGGLNFRTPVID